MHGLTVAMVDVHLGILLLLGIGVLGGALGAWFFQKIRVPQVVGYIVFGIIIGKSGLKLLGDVDIKQLASFTWFALGVIGFLVGGELKLKTFRKYGKQFVQILLWEGISSFLIVALASFGVIYLVTDSIIASLAAGIVFGAIASATDPASTVEVLWEYRSKGVLTTTIIAIVALDDALAMTLYGLGTSCAEMLLGQGTSIWQQALAVLVSLGGSVLFGLVSGAIMAFFLKFIHQKKERMLAISIGMLLVVIGIASALELDVILVTMAMGLILVNLAPRSSEGLFEVVKSFSVPIYIMFFVLVGARLGFAEMPGWLWGVVAVYVIGRSAGKMFGCYMGAKLSGADPVVRKYSGLGIFAQGGVAIGLSIMASHKMGHIAITDTLSLGEVIIAGVTTTTMFVQIIGPALAKLSIKLADEIGRNVTREDVIGQLTVGKAAIKDIEPLRETDSVSLVLKRFSMRDNMAYPVIDAKEKLCGLLTLEQLRDILINTDCWDWMVVADLLVEDQGGISETISLKDAFKLMESRKLEQLAVVSEDGSELIGLLDIRHARKVIEEEMIRIRKKR